jgi:hypothetical protein
MSKLLGMMLVEDKIISFDELSLSLNYQTENGGLLGEILVEFGYIDIDALDFYLKKQQDIRKNA